MAVAVTKSLIANDYGSYTLSFPWWGEGASSLKGEYTSTHSNGHALVVTVGGGHSQDGSDGAGGWWNPTVTLSGGSIVPNYEYRAKGFVGEHYVAIFIGVPVGTTTMELSYPSDFAVEGVTCGLVELSGVDQTAPIRDFYEGNALSGTLSSGGADDLLLSSVSAFELSSDSLSAVDGSTELHHTQVRRGGQVIAAESGGTNFAFNYSRAGSVDPGVIAISLAAEGPSDTTAPSLTNATAVSTGSTTADLGVTTDEGNGTAYAVVTASATAPTPSQIMAGQDATGTAAAWAGSQAVSAAGALTFSAIGLTAGNTYIAHFVHDDAAGNASSVVSSASFLFVAEMPSVNTAHSAQIVAVEVVAWTEVLALNVQSLDQVGASDTVDFAPEVTGVNAIGATQQAPVTDTMAVVEALALNTVAASAQVLIEDIGTLEEAAANAVGTPQGPVAETFDLFDGVPANTARTAQISADDRLQVAGSILINAVAADQAPSRDTWIAAGQTVPNVIGDAQVVADDFTGVYDSLIQNTLGVDQTAAPDQGTILEVSSAQELGVATQPAADSGVFEEAASAQGTEVGQGVVQDGSFVSEALVAQSVGMIQQIAPDTAQVAESIQAQRVSVAQATVAGTAQIAELPADNAVIGGQAASPDRVDWFEAIQGQAQTTGQQNSADRMQVGEQAQPLSVGVAQAQRIETVAILERSVPKGVSLLLIAANDRASILEVGSVNAVALLHLPVEELLYSGTILLPVRLAGRKPEPVSLRGYRPETVNLRGVWAPDLRLYADVG